MTATATSRHDVPAICALLVLIFCVASVSAKEANRDPSTLTVERIFGEDKLKAKDYSAHWLKNGSGFTTLEPSKEYSTRKDIVRHDPCTARTEVLVAAADLIPPGESVPLKIEDYAWSDDLAMLLIYTNSKRVWRRNTRGDYWLLDRAARQLRKLGGDARPSTLMFAKLSPTGQHAAYVRQRNIYIEDLLDHSIRCLTRTESDNVINGTADWVYEEEFGLRDGFAWSPDGKSIAYWQITTEGVQKFPLVNNTDTLYPEVFWFPYPKVGQRNPICRVGVVNCASAETHWITLPGDWRNHYVPRMMWAGESSEELLLQQFNRRQNRNRLFLANLRSVAAEPIFTERDQAWVDVHDELHWIAGGEQFTWISERDGWRHVYLVPRSGGEPKLVTPGEFDVIRLLHVDEDRGWLYFIASPDDASQRYLFRARLDGSDLKQVTPADLHGWHDYQISPDGRWAIHRVSSFGQPPATELIALSDHTTAQVLEENSPLIEKLEKVDRGPADFFRVDIGEGVLLDGWCVKPPDFDATGRYPLLIYVYGEPAGQTVVDRWGGNRYLWHLMLAQRGYIVMSFDNRGTNAPRGRAWRKSAYRKIGILPPRDQAAAVRAVVERRPYVDPSRIGIWGWSGGGSSSLHAVFKYPDLYHTAIAVSPVPNQRYYDTIYQERYMGLPKSNVEGYRKGSPINFASQLDGNLLLIHGTADDNCHYQTVEMLIDELIAHNKQFTMMAYPNRTHALRERKNTTLHMHQLMTQFLLRNLPAGSDDGNLEHE